MKPIRFANSDFDHQTFDKQQVSQQGDCITSGCIATNKKPIVTKQNTKQSANCFQKIGALYSNSFDCLGAMPSLAWTCRELDNPTMERGHREIRESFDRVVDAHCLTFSCFRRLPLLSKHRDCQWMVDAIGLAKVKHLFVRN